VGIVKLVKTSMSNIELLHHFSHDWDCIPLHVVAVIVLLILDFVGE
jgi:hypothetical protein